MFNDIKREIVGPTEAPDADCEYETFPPSRQSRKNDPTSQAAEEDEKASLGIDQPGGGQVLQHVDRHVSGLNESY